MRLRESVNILAEASWLITRSGLNLAFVIA